MWEYTLHEWQHLEKPKHEIIFNCSECEHLNDEWVPFTIGIGYKYALYNKPLIGNHESLVLCALHVPTDQARRGHMSVNRAKIVGTLSKNGIMNRYFQPNTYFSALPTYKFVISPEGNGIDCHRHYESIMAGAIPIVEDHPGIREKYAGCPILYTNDYSEITPAYLESVYQQFLTTKWDFSKVKLSTYPPSIKEQIQKNGNFWGLRLNRRKWYD
jgi:hypothetical protein